ncbi:unnamed protein product [Trichogramma brassicae]|uniref:Uncharacterized protein n=1 Tax=Trichogramma brassicae TaxID=86971 RepID=A0A6H5HV90_9HYME|nr:unnamed protein product [Trichogramma brassicae]
MVEKFLEFDEYSWSYESSSIFKLKVTSSLLAIIECPEEYDLQLSDALTVMSSRQNACYLPVRSLLQSPANRSSSSYTSLTTICRPPLEREKRRKTQLRHSPHCYGTSMARNLSNEKHQLIQVDVRDNLGNTPLLSALDCCNEKLAKVLLRNGADPSLANAAGFTALHIICWKWPDSRDSVEMLFEIGEEKHQLVQVDARDNLGRTPLQWAVAGLGLNMIDALLDRGADLSNFTFPTASHFDEYSRAYQSMSIIKVKKTFEHLAVVECLQKRGYDLQPSDALTLMELFFKYELLEKSKNLELLLCRINKVSGGQIANSKSSSKMIPNSEIRDGMIYKTETPKGFFRGLLPTLLQIAPHAGLQFGTYELMKDIKFLPGNLPEDSHHHKRVSVINSLVAGCLAGLVAKTIVYPLDLARKRMQIQGFEHGRKGFGGFFRCSGLIHCLVLTVKQEGVAGLFKGLVPSQWKAALMTALHFTFYEQTLYFIRSTHPIDEK